MRNKILFAQLVAIAIADLKHVKPETTTEATTKEATTALYKRVGSKRAGSK